VGSRVDLGRDPVGQGAPADHEHALGTAAADELAEETAQRTSRYRQDESPQDDDRFDRVTGQETSTTTPASFRAECDARASAIDFPRPPSSCRWWYP
jgi:hypothetical protein